jgi:colanic acid/amylovoran biosynthesis protein
MDRLRNAFPGKFFTDEKVEIKQLPLKITSIDNSPAVRKMLRLYAKLFRHTKIFKKLGIDSVLILGGDDISEYYKKWMILSDLYRIRRYAGAFPTILAGQTIGPFKGFREKAAAICLSGTVIHTRDELSFSYLQDRLKLPSGRIHSSADLCFPDLPAQEQAAGILETYQLKPDQYITLVPGGFYRLYTRDRSGYIKAWVQLVKELLDTEAYRSKKLVLLPHVTRPEDDRKIIRIIYRTLLGNEANPERLCMIEDELMPHQLRQILGSGRMTVSSRMHAALSTFQMRKPAIALGYSVKYEGVIGRSVGCPQLVVPCTAKLLHDPEQFAALVLDKSSYIEAHYPQLIRHLETRIPQLQTLAEDQISKLCSSDIH